jgi:hypothetical protein
MKTTQLLIILLVIAFVIVMLLVGSGVIFGKASALFDINKDLPVSKLPWVVVATPTLSNMFAYIA